MTDTVETQSPEQVAQEADAAMAAGFDAARGNEAPVAPAKTEVKPDTPAAPATEVKEETKVVDEWEGVSPKVKAEIQAIRSSLEPVKNISDRLRNYEGALGGIKTQISQLSETVKTAVAAKATTVAEAKGEATPTQDEVRVALKDPARMKQLKEDYPDWTDVFEGELGAVYARIEAAEKRIAPPVDTSALKTEVASDVDKRIAAALAPAIKDAEARAEARARTHAYLDFKHGPGWEQRIGTPEFEAWYSKQPKDVQSLSASADVQDASKMLALYEAHQKKAAEKAERDKRLDRAAQPEGVQVTATTTEDPDAAMAAGFAAVRGG